MADTWRGERRKRGAKKSRDHFARSRWGSHNDGRRLRSLKTDLADFDHGRKRERDDASRS